MVRLRMSLGLPKMYGRFGSAKNIYSKINNVYSKVGHSFSLTGTQKNVINAAMYVTGLTK